MAWRGTPDEASVYTAAGMAADQAHCSDEDGLTKLIARADELTRSVPDAARLVIAGVIRFDS